MVGVPVGAPGRIGAAVAGAPAGRRGTVGAGAAGAPAGRRGTVGAGMPGTPAGRGGVKPEGAAGAPAGRRGTVGAGAPAGRGGVEAEGTSGEPEGRRGMVGVPTGGRGGTAGEAALGVDEASASATVFGGETGGLGAPAFGMTAGFGGAIGTVGFGTGAVFFSSLMRGLSKRCFEMLAKLVGAVKPPAMNAVFFLV